MHSVATESGTSPANPLGKLVGGKRYLHVSTIPSLEESLAIIIDRASSVAGTTAGREFNVVRIDPMEDTVALLNYPSFFDEAFPPLARSWKVRLADGRVTLRTYED